MACITFHPCSDSLVFLAAIQNPKFIHDCGRDEVFAPAARLFCPLFNEAKVAAVCHSLFKVLQVQEQTLLLYERLCVCAVMVFKH